MNSALDDRSSDPDESASDDKASNESQDCTSSAPEGDEEQGEDVFVENRRLRDENKRLFEDKERLRRELETALQREERLKAQLSQVSTDVPVVDVLGTIRSQDQEKCEALLRGDYRLGWVAPDSIEHLPVGTSIVQGGFRFPHYVTQRTPGNMREYTVEKDRVLTVVSFAMYDMSAENTICSESVLPSYPASFCLKLIYADTMHAVDVEDLSHNRDRIFKDPESVCQQTMQDGIVSWRFRFAITSDDTRPSGRLFKLACTFVTEHDDLNRSYPPTVYAETVPFRIVSRNHAAKRKAD